MQNKEITVLQTTAGEKADYLSEYNTFKNKLTMKSITSIFDNPRMKIKRDLKDDGSGGSTYIFAIDGTNEFSISEANVEEWIRKYCKEKETLKAEEEIKIEAKGLKIEYAKSTTQAELDTLKNEINQDIADEAKATNIESVKTILLQNLLYLEQQKDYAKTVDKSDKIDRNLRKAFTSQVQDRIDRLNRMKESISKLEANTDKVYTIDRPVEKGKDETRTIDMTNINKYDMKETLKQISVRLKEVADEEEDFIRTRNSITNKELGIVPDYQIIINDKKDAAAMRKALKKYNKQYGILDKISLDATKKQLVAMDLEKFEQYLNKVQDEGDTFNPAENPFVPSQTADFYELVKKDETLSSFVAFNKNKKETAQDAGTGTAGTGTTETGTETGTGTSTDKDKEKTTTTQETYDDAGEAFQKGGIGGVLSHLLDKTNLSDKQKQTRGGVGKFALTAGLVFVGRKMVSSAFKMIFKSKKGTKETPGTGIYDSKNRAWLGIPTALLFASQATTGEGPMKLFTGGKGTEKIASLFGRGDKTSDSNVDKEVTDKEVYTEGFAGLMGVFGGMTYAGMNTFLEEDNNGKMKIKEDQYDGFIKSLEAGTDNQKAGAKFMKAHVDKTDKNGWIDLSLRAMGINSKADLEKTPTTPFDEKIALVSTKLFKLGQYMEKKGYVKVNPETMPLVKDYIGNDDTTWDLDELDKRGDVFELEEAVTDQTGLAAKIKLMTPNDTEKEKYLLNGINDFYTYRPKANKTGLDIIGTGPIVEFKTYDQTTKINIDTKKIEGLTTTEKFDSYAELFKAANLTNRIKDLCKEKTAVKADPFYISTAGGDITFDDAKLFSTSFDTEIVTGGRNGNLEEISPTLEANKSEYCNYLNSTTPKFWKEATT